MINNFYKIMQIKKLKNNPLLTSSGLNKPHNTINTKSIKYSLKFASLITPGTVYKFNNFLLKNNHKYDGSGFEKSFFITGSSNKLLVKQSYMFLTWIFYLKNKDLNIKIKTPSFFIHPKKQTKMTLIKAPMAHKTFSQEQYLFRFYYISLSFTLTNETDNLSSINGSLVFYFKQKKLFYFFGTNLFFFKKITHRLICFG